MQVLGDVPLLPNKATLPTGQALLTGGLVYDTNTATVKVYNGSAWIGVGSGGGGLAEPVTLTQVLTSSVASGSDAIVLPSGAAINFGLDIVRMGGTLSLLGLPAGHSVTIDDYTRNVIFKGVTMHGIIGRRMYSTWQRMLGMLRAGLDVAWVVQATYDSLRDFHDGIAKFDRHEALKVVFFPEGEQAAQRRLER